jgi:predicted kinase
MPRLTITRGLPGSGKSTWAREQRGAVRVNRDDLRRMLHGGWRATPGTEVVVTVSQRALLQALLAAGVDVVCDDTNLRARVVRDLAELAARCEAEFTVQDFTAVPLEECLRRDAARVEGEQVGEEAIREMWQRYLAGRALPLPVPEPRAAAALGAAALGTTGAAGGSRRRPPGALPTAVLVDIDGTIAVLGQRSPYDMTRVGEDAPNRAVIETVRALHAAGHRIVYCSGRTDDAREATEAWLAMNVAVDYDGLHMRRTGDTRKDAVVKAEIFERHLRHRYDILCVLDDRRQVVRMWRALGLTVFQVDEGDF